MTTEESKKSVHQAWYVINPKKPTLAALAPEVFYPTGGEDNDCGTPSVGIEGEANFVDMQWAFEHDWKMLGYSKSVASA